MEPEVVLGERLRDREETLAVAESATGGLVCSTITDVPGSSEYFVRGFVTYAYEAKTGTLGVDRESLDTHGAVSRPVAAEMATGCRDLASATWGVSVTGTAGPAGGTSEKPVGTVYIGVAHAGPWGSGDSWVEVERYEFDGDRLSIKSRAAEQAIADLLSAVNAQ